MSLMAGDALESLTMILASFLDFPGFAELSMARMFPMMEGKSFEEKVNAGSRRTGRRRQEGFTW